MCGSTKEWEKVLYPLGLPETGELIFNKQSFYIRQEKWYVKEKLLNVFLTLHGACFQLYPK